MANENEEALRLFILLGQAIIPAAKDVVKLLTYHGFRIGKDVAQHLGSTAANHIGGLGELGQVNLAKIKNKELVFTEAIDLSRADLRELNSHCNKLGVAFSVVTRPDGAKALAFAAQDAAAFDFAINQLSSVYGITESEKKDIKLAAQPDYEPAGNFVHDGSTFIKDEATHSWSAQTNGLTTVVDSHGNWRIEKDGQTLTMPDKSLAQGRVDAGGVMAATVHACALSKALSNPLIVQHAQDHTTKTAELIKQANASTVLANAELAAKKQQPTRKNSRSHAKSHAHQIR